jgi:hypothetical protein
MKASIRCDASSWEAEYPDCCPICHHHGQMECILGSFTENKSMVEVIFRCAFFGCRRFFIGYYTPLPDNQLKFYRPIVAVDPAFPESIRQLSPQFFAIYREASEARQVGLEQIAGPGFRKAFEFLIKDYAKSLATPSETEAIEKQFSGNVISNYIQDSRIQAVAKRALWLGNDETHYLRKWTGKDIEDLLTLIKLTVDWIEIERLSSQYTNDMKEG